MDTDFDPMGFPMIPFTIENTEKPNKVFVEQIPTGGTTSYSTDWVFTPLWCITHYINDETSGAPWYLTHIGTWDTRYTGPDVLRFKSKEAATVYAEAYLMFNEGRTEVQRKSTVINLKG